MNTKTNPLKLNALQLKTLTLLQEIAKHEQSASPDDGGGVRITRLPRPHGDHFHLGDWVVRAADATGLANEVVWKALERKGLARSAFPLSITLTLIGLEYVTGLRQAILQTPGH